MSITDRGQPLAGLVIAAAEALYLRLRATGGARLGTGTGAVNPQAAATIELLELGLAVRAGDQDDLICPVDHAVALRLLLKHRQAEVINIQRRLIEGWSKLGDLLPRNVGTSRTAEVAGITPIADSHEVTTRLAEVYLTARHRIRVVETGVPATAPAKELPNMRPQIPSDPGLRSQIIYPLDYSSTPVGAAVIAESVRRGAVVRLCPKVPLKMLHVDDSVAILSTDRSASAALLVHAPAMLVMLATWFDLLWSDSTTMAPTGNHASPLTENQQRVLQLMAVDGDEAIARRLNMSITTVRRHVRTIYEALGVDSRFAAGAAAAKRGWI